MIVLRTHSTAQKEIRDLAQEMYNLAKQYFPIACSAFENFWLHNVTFHQDEIEILQKKKNKSILGKRRLQEFETKCKLLSHQ